MRKFARGHAADERGSAEAVLLASQGHHRFGREFVAPRRPCAVVTHRFNPNLLRGGIGVHEDRAVHIFEFASRLRRQLLDLDDLTSIDASQPERSLRDAIIPSQWIPYCEPDSFSYRSTRHSNS